MSLKKSVEAAAQCTVSVLRPGANVAELNNSSRIIHDVQCTKC